MTGYDPVRESSQPSSAPSQDVQQSGSSFSSHHYSQLNSVGPDDSQYSRRPSRSASLVDILNPSDQEPSEPPRPGSSASSNTSLRQWAEQRNQQSAEWTSVESTARGSPRFSDDITQAQQTSQLPIVQTRPGKSPSLRFSTIMNPSPGSTSIHHTYDVRSASHFGRGSINKELSQHTSPSAEGRREGCLSREGSYEVGQGQYLQADGGIPSRIQGRASRSASGSPLMANVPHSGSPHEVPPMNSFPTQTTSQTYRGYENAESPRSASFAPLPPTGLAYVSPQLRHATLDNASQRYSYRSADGFRIPPLPTHRSPEVRRVPLPSAGSSPSTSYNRSNEIYGAARGAIAHPVTPMMTSGFPSAPDTHSSAPPLAGHDYFQYRATSGPPITPGGRDVLSPITPGEAMTPDSAVSGDRPKITAISTPTGVTSNSSAPLRASSPITLTESNMRAFDRGQSVERPTSSSRMSVDGLLTKAPSLSAITSDSRPESIAQVRRPSASDLNVSADRDGAGQKRPRPTVTPDATSHKRSKAELITAVIQPPPTSGERAPDTAVQSAVLANRKPNADELVGNGSNDSGQRRSSGTSRVVSPDHNGIVSALKRHVMTNTSLTEYQGHDNFAAHTSPSATAAETSQTASSNVSKTEIEPNGTVPSVTSNSVFASSAAPGKVKLIDAGEMDLLSSRDSKKRKSVSATTAAEPTTNFVKAEKALPSSLPSRPTFATEPESRATSKTDTVASPLRNALPAFGDGRLPYRPAHRVSAPDSIRRPLTQQDLIALHSTIEARGANTLRRRWIEEERVQGRTGNDGFALILESWGKGHGDGGTRVDNSTPPASASQENEVARHYNSRQELGLQARNFSPILPLKNFNNWVKSILIGSFGSRGGKAMDMGGGKGGDLQKWDKLNVRELVLADIAATSVEQAKARYLERRFKWKASFYALDCFGDSLSSTLPPEVLEPPFDTVSLQFCMHYGWSSLQRARLVIENVSRYLVKGGIFIGTIPNSEELYRRRHACGGDELTFGNGKYRVTFEQKEKMKPFGDRYTFFLDDAVDEVPEYVVVWDQFESLAKECGLNLIFKKTMAEVWETYRHDREFESLARRMKVSPSPRHDTQPMEDDLWEATTIYLAFAFEKFR